MYLCYTNHYEVLMKTITKFLRNYWRYIVIGLAVVIASYFIIFSTLSTMPGYSSQEIAAQSSSTSLNVIWHNPINAIYKLMVWVPFKLGHHSVLWTRFAAGIIATISAALFYFIVYSLFSHRIAILTTILFVTSSGFLHAAHLGTPLILQIFGVITLLALIPAYLLMKGKILPLYITVATLVFLLYIPGIIWFVLVGIIVLNKRILHTLKTLDAKHQIYLGLIVLVLLAPLAWAYIQHPSLALTGLGLPASMPQWHEIVSRAETFGRSLLWAGNGPAEIMLVGAPLLNIVEFSLLFIGIAVQFKKPRLTSNFFVIGATLFIVLLIIFGGIISYVTLTPLLYLLMAGGIFYLLTQWHKVFPINPFAHFVGMALICGLVAMSVLYHVESFYTAWPYNNATKAAFSRSQPTHYDTKSIQKAPIAPQIGPTF